MCVRARLSGIAVLLSIELLAASSPRALEHGRLSGDAHYRRSLKVRQETLYGAAIHHVPSVIPDQLVVSPSLSDGSRVVAVRFTKPQSAGVRLHFRNVRLSSGMLLYIYGIGVDETPVDIYGPFTGAGPLETGEFWTPAIPGDQVIVEFQVSGGLPSDLPFEVFELASLAAGDAALSTLTPADPGSRTSPEMHRFEYKGVPMEYEIRDGLAIFENDIVLSGEAPDRSRTAALEMRSNR